jgi:hypothetical protein
MPCPSSPDAPKPPRPDLGRAGKIADEIAANLRLMGLRSTPEPRSSLPSRIGGMVSAQHALTLQRVWWSR